MADENNKISSTPATVDFTSTQASDVEFDPAPAIGAAVGGNAGASTATGSGGFNSGTTGTGDGTSGSTGNVGVKDTIRTEASKLQSQAADRARSFAGDGKAKATGTLNEFARMMDDAAGTVDEKLGAQYGGYARSAAGYVSGFADTLDRKDVDELLDDARMFVRKSPMIAIGTAAALGFVLARVIKAGVEGSDDYASATGAGTPADVGSAPYAATPRV